MATMLDVAKLAGVSVKTVSRVINNEPHVQDALRVRVKTAAKNLGYVPSASARSLRSRRSYQVHLINHATTGTYIHCIQAGALQVCQDGGYQLLVSVMSDHRGDLAEAFKRRFERQLERAKPDGVILVPPFADVDGISRWLTNQDIAVARIGVNTIDNCVVSVLIDEFKAAQDLTSLLVERGHKRIAFIRGSEDQSATEERFRGYASVLEDAGIQFDPDLVIEGDFHFPTGLAAGLRLFEMTDRPTAVFAANDDMAAGVIVAGHKLGLVAPRDFSVVGFDDADIAEMTWPALTTVRQPVLDFGTVATLDLIRSFEEGDGSRVSTRRVLDYELVLRDSVGPPPSTR
ncbi:MAG: LacI family DNA-binding transcriptional regulator [Pseudomonadota bacterium]